MWSTAMASRPTSDRPPWPTPSMPSRLPDAALRDILHHIDLATRLVDGFDEVSFREDVRTLYAVTRCLEIISEALAPIARGDEGAPSGHCLAPDGERRQRLSA